ncbi:survival motor neuron protein [Drosophila bipectinata]|uniref:survival motor neuron protein n=1 Tax=Drosophila bipectinata TaxID=42026 RepID=UPI001C8A9CE8|nr:survival motor neuron protein [Drosophila bipectinata]
MTDQTNPNSAVWDDSLLVKTYDESVGLLRETLARRLADSTNKRDEEQVSVPDDAADDGKEPVQIDPEPLVFKVGDYARATYTVDGLDYEGAVVSINDKNETCIIRFLGYENEQEVLLNDLLPSWGKNVRREQFLAAKEEAEEEPQPVPSRSKAASSSTNPPKKSSGKKTGEVRASGSGGSGMAGPVMPPMPLVPPMFASPGDAAEQDFVAMLTAWYMSGYYTGLYQGKKEANAAAKKKTPKK